uniref:ShKT domain-containing protein n=1 Tax=Ascaris lumbricoides TaxID=6252 RepID=A0A0M3IQS0_ASCLU
MMMLCRDISLRSRLCMSRRATPCTFSEAELKNRFLMSAKSCASACAMHCQKGPTVSKSIDLH